MNLKTLFLLSLVVNAALLASVGYLAKRSPSAATTSTQSAAGEPASTPAVSKTLTEKKTATRAVTNTIVATVDWRAVESEDYKKYIANLRAIGCPEETIRDIIVADVNKLFESRKQAITANKKKYEYWKAGQGMIPMPDDETIKARQQLTDEKRNLLRELLGVDVSDSKAELAAAAMNPITAMLDFLPAEKADKIFEIMMKTQSQALKGLKGGQPDAEDLKAIQKVKTDMQAELAKVLTPEEMRDYQLRLSDTAVMMRMQLAAFEPSQTEFNQLFDARKAFDDKYPMMLQMTLDKDQKAERDAAQKDLDKQIKSILGDDRYTEYQRGSDFAFQTMAKVAERNNLPKEAAIKVYDVKKIAEDQAKQVRANKDLSDDQRKQALQAIRTETEAQVRGAFGDQAYEAYQKQPTSSYWLKNLTDGK